MYKNDDNQYYCINQDYCTLVVFLCFAVDDLVNNYRLGILKAIKRPRTNRRSRPKLHPPVDIVNIDARTFAEQLTYIDAVRTTDVLIFSQQIFCLYKGHFLTDTVQLVVKT